MSPDNRYFDDNMFPRTVETIGRGNAAYGEKGSTWIKMHDI
jgi:hypothetical protein